MRVERQPIGIQPRREQGGGWRIRALPVGEDAHPLELFEASLHALRYHPGEAPDARLIDDRGLLEEAAMQSEQRLHQRSQPNVLQAEAIDVCRRSPHQDPRRGVSAVAQRQQSAQLDRLQGVQHHRRPEFRACCESREVDFI